MSEISGNNRSREQINRYIKDAATLGVPDNEKQDLNTAVEQSQAIVDDFFDSGKDGGDGLDAKEYRSLLNELPESRVRTFVENVNQTWYEDNPVTEGQKLYSENIDILQDFNGAPDSDYDKLKDRIQEDLNLSLRPGIRPVGKKYNHETNSESTTAVRFNKLQIQIKDDEQNPETRVTTGIVFGAKINPDTGKFEDLSFNQEAVIGSQLEKAVIAGRERVRKDLENFNPNNGLEFDDYKGYTKGNLPGTLHDVKGTFKNEDGDKVTFRIFNPYGSRIGDEALAPPTSIGTQVKFQYEDGSGAILNGSQVPESFFDKIKANEPENSSGLR